MNNPEPRDGRRCYRTTMIRTGFQANTRIAAAILASLMLHAVFVALDHSGWGDGAAITANSGLHFEHPLQVRIGETPVAAPQAVATPVVAAPGPPKVAAVRVKPSDKATQIAREGEAPAQSGAEWSLFETVAYYPSSALDRRPQAIGEVTLEPVELRRMAVSGALNMTLWISPEGEVDRATVDHSELPEVFSAASVEAFKRLRFTPGELDGRTVGTMMKIEVTYENPRALRIPPGSPSTSAAEP